MNAPDLGLVYVSFEDHVIQFEIKAAVTIPEDAFIRAGYSANAEIVLKRAEDVLTIPESTVEFQGDSAFVQLVKQEQPEQVFGDRYGRLDLKLNGSVFLNTFG